MLYKDFIKNYDKIQRIINLEAAGLNLSSS